LRRRKLWRDEKRKTGRGAGECLTCCRQLAGSPVATDAFFCQQDAGSTFKKQKLMSKKLPILYLARHGETTWSLSGQHTGLTDLPLTERGERNARELGERLRGLTFTKVFTSPLQRAAKTCELTGFGAVAETDRDLVEWDYGAYEGLKSAEIHAQRPGWNIFRDGCPNGESPAQIIARADRVVQRVRAVGGDVLVFSSGHFLRSLVTRWLGLDLCDGNRFLLSTTSLSLLSYEHNLSEPAVKLWNDARHVTE